MGKTTVLGLCVLLCLSVCACGTQTNIISVAYQPTTTATLSGTVEVRKFNYTNWLGPNYLPYSGKYLSENIDTYFSDAIKRELIQAKAITAQQARCRIAGTVLDVNFHQGIFNSGDYKSQVRYNLTLDNGRPVYANIFETKYHGSDDLRENVVKVFSDNIKQLLTDPDFQLAFKEWCMEPLIVKPAASQDTLPAVASDTESKKRVIRR